MFTEPDLEGGRREKEHVGEMETKRLKGKKETVRAIQSVLEGKTKVHLVHPPVFKCILKTCRKKSRARKAEKLKKKSWNIEKQNKRKNYFFTHLDFIEP